MYARPAHSQLGYLPLVSLLQFREAASSGRPYSVPRNGLCASPSEHISSSEWPFEVGDLNYCDYHSWVSYHFVNVGTEAQWDQVPMSTQLVTCKVTHRALVFSPATVACMGGPGPASTAVYNWKALCVFEKCSGTVMHLVVLDFLCSVCVVLWGVVLVYKPVSSRDCAEWALWTIPWFSQRFSLK